VAENGVTADSLTVKELELQAGDLHLVFDDTGNLCKVFRKGDGSRLFACPMKNTTVRKGFKRHGWCPRGDYLLGAPTDVHLIPFGKHFTPLFDLDSKGPMHTNGRRGIGIHGGGSGLRDPFADVQGWQITEGCLRVQNGDNAQLVALIRRAQANGRKAYLTVQGKPG
jgi:hypothetical protein